MPTGDALSKDQFGFVVASKGPDGSGGAYFPTQAAAQAHAASLAEQDVSAWVDPATSPPGSDGRAYIVTAEGPDGSGSDVFPTRDAAYARVDELWEQDVSAWVDEQDVSR